MRVLLLLRGSAGCGKSTWIEQNGLKPYALSADDIRLLCQSPVLQPDGTVGISQSCDKTVWKTLFNLLEIRMQKGEFTVIDATNSKTSEMNRYKQMCETYRYRIYCVDFTDIPIEEVKRRNANREELKRVPDEVIDKMYSRFKTQKIPSGIKVIKPNELDTIWMKLFDLSEYKKIHHIGDVHGCYTALKKYLDDNGGIKDDEFYIFCGDYVDRGIENADVIKYLISIKDKKNVLMLEGNHERWLWLWANGCTGKSKEFELVTKPQLEEAEIDKKDVRQLYRKFGQCAYYKYGENIYLVTHAGLSVLPDNLTFVATDQMIHGVGSYNDFEKIAETFAEKMPSNYYQIHGHRNTKQVPIRVNDRVFNLEGRVEFGGDLRGVQLDKDGLHGVEIHNEVFKTSEMREEQSVTNSSVADVIISLRANRYIQEKKFGNISSFNFTSKAFYDKIWDEQTTKARGLYLDTFKGKVAARAYDKFFNINERPETKFDMLQNKLQFPVTAYVKENGYLGIVSYDEYNDDLFIASKSTIDSQFAEWLKEAIYEQITPENREKMKQFAKDNNVSFVFENVDMKNDPHIIEYLESKLYLLDIVYNQMDFAKYDYEMMCDIAHQFGLTPKEKAFEIANWQDFYDWYYDILEEDYEYNNRKIEGFVIEDSVGYMTKLKLTYYNFWKFMRAISHEAIRNGYIKKTSALTTPLANEYYAWVRKLHNVEDIDSVPRDICTLRRLFFKDKMGE
ncbi:RNA ligase [uncultured Eubacterium sp.]|uniref:RNA ligase n=1 Tax=uncultured Eubacterium sp. TaxID=165185 RepID=UPI0025914697|nr:RNA ligase [uncultured Eubacterium sp.]